MHEKLTTAALLISSTLAFALLVYSAYDENLAADWYIYQKEYKQQLTLKADDDRARLAAKRYDIGQKQIFLSDLNRVDRCVTCHVAVDNPAMADAPQPLTSHPGDFMTDHPKERFGCTVCHRGQGRATEQDDAHGHVPHWLDPMVAPEEIFQACIRCHTDRSLAGSDEYNTAMELVYEKACFSCHRIRGKGGNVGPALDRAGEINDAEWHFKHFKDPKSVVATSEMPNLNLTDQEANQLTVLVMGLTGPPVPMDLLSIPNTQADQAPAGDDLDPLALEDFVGSKFCISCHKGTHPDAVNGWRQSRMATTFQRIKDEPVKDNCLPCHTTGYNPETGHYIEEGVACEACHGPGKEAVKLVLRGRADEHKKMIRINPQSKLVCARCHNPHVPVGTHADYYRQLPPRNPDQPTTPTAKFESPATEGELSKVIVSVPQLLQETPDPPDAVISSAPRIVTPSEQATPQTESALPVTPVNAEDVPAASSENVSVNNQDSIEDEIDGGKTTAKTESSAMHTVITDEEPAITHGRAVIQVEPRQDLSPPGPESDHIVTPVRSLGEMSSSNLASSPIQFDAQAGCTTRGCHTEMIADYKVHGPTAVGLCQACHKTVDADAHRFELTKEQPDLCYQCHGEPPDAEFLHGPVALGMCTACHNPHSGPERLMLRKDGQDLCFTCHTEMGKHVNSAQVQHGAVVEYGCTECHSPHREDHKFQLKDAVPDLCLNCHPQIEALVEEATTPHGAVEIKKKCVNCHNPHGSNVPRILRNVEMDLCLSCHNEPMDTPTGTIIDMKSWIENNPERHGPIRLKLCTACHQPHGSKNFRILKRTFPAEFYKPFELEIYALCFGCHEKTLVLDKRTTTLTGFRNGDKNLHFAHVNQEKGRTCRACHEIHAGTKPKRIKDFVPFGDWKYPLNYEKNENGGGCAPGCHVPRRYDRREEIVQK